jgi:tryptophanyl-tRNA synthetase
MRELTSDSREIDAILHRGAEKADALSAPVLAEVKRIVGFLKP